MRRLLLLRHAKAEWPKPGQADRNRALNARGRAAAPLVGAFLERHALLPDVALVSTATRTRETWELLAPHLSRQPKIVFDERIYHAEPETILDVIGEVPDGISSLMVVGHNPGLQELALELATSGDIDARARMNEKFGTAAFAVLAFTAGDWASIGARGGRLERFVSPAALVADPD